MNIVFITVDTWRYDALGVAPDKHRLEEYGVVEKLQTPNLDRFAQESVYFCNAFVTAPHTPPSHASIMTGLFPPQHGVRSFCYERLPPNVRTLAEVLRDHGYATITLRESEHVSEPGILEKVDVLRGFHRVVHNLKDFSAAAQEAAEGGQSVFAFLHLWDLHAPYLYSDWAREVGVLDPLHEKAEALACKWDVQLPNAGDVCEEMWMRFQREVAGSIEDKDLRIRTLLEWYVEGVSWFDRYRWPSVESALKDAGLWDDTVIFVFADHGEAIHPDGVGFNVLGHGQSLLDDVIRVPLVVRGMPGSLSRHIDTQVSLVDLAPTVLEALALSASDLLGLDPRSKACGRSLLPLLDETGDAEAAGGHLVFAELCRAETDEISLVPQYLYQRCARGNGYKVVCHNGPIWMERYVDWRQWIRSKWHGGLRRVGLSSDTRSVVVEDGVACDVLHWVDLEKDPLEASPRRWGGRVPQGVVDLRLALEGLYEDTIRGPAIESDHADESALRRRLAALGYIDG
ncbi:MAG: sulfatase [Chloroflexota bacterium]|nr:sulfatase [Chloroflexota bacterium]